MDWFRSPFASFRTMYVGWACYRIDPMQIDQIFDMQVDGCRLLVRKGASLTLRTSPDALPPLHLAASHGTLACIEVMFASLL
jgi:hypothetical protein